MALPRVRVHLLAEAEDLRHLAFPHAVRVERVERIGDAPAMEEAIHGKAGWKVEGMELLTRASRLDARLRTLRDVILPALLLDPTDASSLRHLTGQVQAVRSIGIKFFGLLRILAVGLGNRFRKVAHMMMKGKRAASWLAVRLDGLQLCVDRIREASAATEEEAHEKSGCQEKWLQGKLDDKSGWEVNGIEQLGHASRLDARLRILRDLILPALVLDSADASALRRLMGQAQAIRRIGSKSPGNVRTLVVGLGNRLRKVANMVLKGKRPASWLAHRIDSIQVHAKKVHKSA